MSEPKKLSHHMPADFFREVREHEVLISFNDDESAELFHEWWHNGGFDAFSNWVNSEDKS